MKKKFFQQLAKFNKKVLPSLAKKNLDLEQATKLQLALLGYRVWVTKHALD